MRAPKLTDVKGEVSISYNYVTASNRKQNDTVTDVKGKVSISCPYVRILLIGTRMIQM